MARKRRSTSVKTMTSKRQRYQRSKVMATKSTTNIDPDERTPANDYFSRLSLEMICQILEYLPIWDVMKMECQCRHLQKAVNLHLQLLTDIDFTEGVIHGWMPTGFTDSTLKHFLKRCPELMYIYGLHVDKVNKRRQRRCNTLSIPGIVDALQQCDNLTGVETSNIFLLEAILIYLPEVEVMGTFKNRNASFPIPPQNSISLVHGARLTSLHLSGVELTDLPPMYFLKQLHLKWVRFTDPNPFRNFEMPRLRSFVMNNCAGPQSALKYLPLMNGLASATALKRLELVRVPFLAGLIYHVVEDSWRVSGFRSLSKFKIGACKHVQEADLGYLMIASKNKLEELYIQPSLTRDNFFYSLIHAEVDFHKLHSLHLGFVDDFPEPGKWTQEELVAHGLADYVENPAFVTDFGMKCVADVFPQLTQLKLYNCPQIYNPTTWITAANPGVFSQLTDLQLHRCHAVKLSDFCTFISLLPNLEHLLLENMFKEPPKGCSRVGLSAGLGVSSALAGGHSADNQNLLNPLANQHVAMQQAANHNQPDNDHNDMPANEELDSEGEQQVERENAFDVHDEDMDYEEGDHSAANQNLGLQSAANGIQADDVECETDHQQMNALKSDRGQSMAADAGESSRNHRNLDKPGTSTDSGDSGLKGVNVTVPGHTESRHNETSAVEEQFVEVDCYVWSSDEKMAGTAQETDGNITESGRINGVVGSSTVDASENSTSSINKSLKNQEGGKCEANECSLLQESSDNNKVLGPQASTGDSETSTGDLSAVPIKGDESGLSDPSAIPNSDNHHTSDVTDDNSEPCSSNGGSHDQAPGGHSSKGKLLKNRSMSCYPKGRNAGCAKKGTKLAETSEQNGILRRVDLPKHGSSSDRVRDEKNSAGESPQQHNSVGRDQQEEIPDRGQEDIQLDRQDPPAGVDLQDAVHDDSHPPRAKGQNSDLKDKAQNIHKQSNSGNSSGRHAEAQETRPQQGSQKCSQTKKRTVNLQEPRIEDDHPQVFTVKSSSLLSLNLHCVGVTDIIITDCRKLSSLTVSGCRVLKNVHIDKAPVLAHSSFVQCPKIRYEDVVDEICQLPPKQHRLVHLRPVRKYNAASLERQLLSTKTYGYHVCLLHDYSPDPEQTLYNRIRVTSWPDVITSVNSNLIQDHKHPKVTDAAEVISDQYPWRQGIYRMQGKSADGSEWDLVCDIPWIETLASDEDRMNESWIYSDSKVGVYSPSAKGHCCVASAEKRLEKKIEEIRQLKRPLFLHPVIIYVNLCDLNGIVPDKYV